MSDYDVEEEKPMEERLKFLQKFLCKEEKGGEKMSYVHSG